MEYKKLPDLNGWATLCAVVEFGGVSEAAKALHIGQPAVTKRLRSLDSCYGINLMQRVAGRLKLTEAGEKVYLLATQTLDQQNILQRALSQLALGHNSMRLEVTSSISKYLLPKVLLRFIEAYPSFKIDTRTAYSRKIHTHLATRIADLALLEYAPEHPDILVQKWQEDELWLVCGYKHPMRDLEYIDIDVLTTVTYALRESQSSMRYTMTRALQRIGIHDLKIDIEVGSTDTVIEILTQGKQLSFLPRFAVVKRVADGSLFHIKVKGFRIMRTLWIARHRSRVQHPVVEAFIDMLLAVNTRR